MSDRLVDIHESPLNDSNSAAVPLRRMSDRLRFVCMEFAVQPTLSKDSTKIVLVAGNPGPYPGVWATVACEDIRQEFRIPGTPNEVLLQRASIRQTSKEALQEESIAWGQWDLPPILLQLFFLAPNEEVHESPVGDPNNNMAPKSDDRREPRNYLKPKVPR